jgi:hypothetical protein
MTARMEVAMRLAPIGRLLVSLVILTLPVAAHAQEATFAGTVTDSTGGVLPGVTITAVHEAAATRLRPSPTSAGNSACRCASASTGSRPN